MLGELPINLEVFCHGWSGLVSPALARRKHRGDFSRQQYHDGCLDCFGLRIGHAMVPIFLDEVTRRPSRHSRQ